MGGDFIFSVFSDSTDVLCDNSKHLDSKFVLFYRTLPMYNLRSHTEHHALLDKCIFRIFDFMMVDVGVFRESIEIPIGEMKIN